ncbi:MAG: DUF5107 domain-containing protein [Cyclobacteriaceae bacterium]
MEVKAWKEIVTIPTYGIGEPEKNPIFLENRVYQGSSGAVYPNPVVEKIFDEKEDKEWIGLFLENEYLKIMILPELGGRIQMAYDKSKKRHFVYYNQVIKPALVGLTGPWISGGIEFNWPQHHRPSTYEPIDFSIEENEDGSKTVWVSEIERMFRTKGMAGYTLYEDKAYLEIKAQLYNRTPHPQTFLWWANPAVKVNEHYQSVFPPDVNAVFDHGKRDVSTFPVATGTYYKVDYSAGVDISKYKNIPVPTSYMSINSENDFVGGYENDSKGGVLHVANHHVSPGKKQWTWGNGEFGYAWDRNLTDEDGPYIELMCGVYTDNQPDFSWLHPYEEKSFKQYFMPYRDLGVVKNATKEAMLNLSVDGCKARIQSFTTGVYPGSKLLLLVNNEHFFEEVVDFAPDMSFERTISLPDGVSAEDCHLALYNQDGVLLVDYIPQKKEEKPIPDPAKLAKKPHEIETTEQLYLRGLHLEQYRHATYKPIDYYHEALRRDPGDIRNNNALGLWLMKRAKFQEAETHFRTAIETLTERNPNPYDGEPFFNLGLCLKFQNRLDEAYAVFYKATWNAAWQDAAYFHLAQIACIWTKYHEAEELIHRSLSRNWNNHSARTLKAAILRKLGKEADLETFIEESLKLDRFNFGVLHEKHLLTKDIGNLKFLKEQLRDDVHNYIELSLEYAAAGFYETASNVLEVFAEGKTTVYPMVYYFQGSFACSMKNEGLAIHLFSKACSMPSDYCFPSRLEEVLMLQAVIQINPADAKANYYLGNFYYANRQYEEARIHWEESRKIDDSFDIVHRNLALAYYNKFERIDEARISLEKAFSINQSPRNLMELDQLYKKLNYAYHERLAFLEKYPRTVEDRDDLALEQITLLNLVGQEKKALELIQSRNFHPWEGGEGKVPGQYIYSHVEMAKKAIQKAAFEQAIMHLDAAKEYPHNLGEGKLCGAQENDIYYWQGVAYEGLGLNEKAIESWNEACHGLSEPTAAIYYNDQSPDKIFYQGLALQKLGRSEEAKSRFNKLIAYGEKHIHDKVDIDYFAVSLPDLLIFDDDPSRQNTIHCKYLMALGYLGLNRTQEAQGLLGEIIIVSRYHAGAYTHKNYISNFMTTINLSK